MAPPARVFTGDIIADNACADADCRAPCAHVDDSRVELYTDAAPERRLRAAFTGDPAGTINGAD